MKPLPDIDLLKEILTYDPESGELRWKVKRSPYVNAGDTAGSVNSKGYMLVMINYVHYSAHRIAWALHYGEDPYPNIIDHKEGKEAGNGINNLRLADLSANGLNRKKQVNNTSGHRGVHYCKTTQKWVAQIAMKGKRLTIGRYKTVEEAISARLKAEADNNIYVRAS
jgi:hypothetical protein